MIHFKNRDLCKQQLAVGSQVSGVGSWLIDNLRLKTEDRRLKTADWRLMTANWRLPTPGFRLPTSNPGLKTLQLTMMLIFVLFAVSCKMEYSFTGASIAPEVKTIRIDNFPNNALLVNPTLSQEFTDALRNKFQEQTSLILVNNGGDMIIEGEITDYQTRPTAIQSDDVAALNRLTISIKVKFTNTFDESQSFNQTFTRYEDYPSTQDLTSVAEKLVQQINEYLVEDVFNKAVVKW